MATLSTAEKAKIQELIDYLDRGTVHDLPQPELVSQFLTPMAAKFGFTGHAGHDAGFPDSYRDAPITTLLKALLAVAA